MNPFRLALITLVFSFIVSAIPYAVDRLSLAHKARETESPTQFTQQQDILAATPLYLNAQKIDDLPSISELAQRQAPVSIPVSAGEVMVADASRDKPEPPAPEQSAPAASATPDRSELEYRPEIAQAQELLGKAGFSPGKVDGRLGQKTKSAVEQFQKSKNMAVTGEVDGDTMKRLADFVASGQPDRLVAQAAPTPERAAAEKTPEPSAEKTPPAGDITPGKPVETAAVTQAVAMLPKPAVETAGAVPVGVIAPARAVSENTAAPAKEQKQAEPVMVAGLPNASLPAPQTLEVSKPASNPTTEVVLNPEVVVRVESAVISTSGTMETPVTVSKELLDNVSDQAIAVAQPDARTSEAIVIKNTDKADSDRQVRLDREMVAAQANAAASDFGAHPEVSTLAPLAPGPINKLIETAGRNSNKDTEPERGNKVLVAKQTASPQTSSSKKAEAETKVAQVEKVYKQLKANFSDQIKKGELADVMAKVDAGYKAMKEDLGKGNYAPIIEKGDGFKMAIDNLLSNAAKAYVETNLKDKGVRAKLKRADLAQVEKLRTEKEYLEAAESLQKRLKQAKPRSGGRS